MVVESRLRFTAGRVGGPGAHRSFEDIGLYSLPVRLDSFGSYVDELQTAPEIVEESRGGFLMLLRRMLVFQWLQRTALPSP